MNVGKVGMLDQLLKEIQEGYSEITSDQLKSIIGSLQDMKRQVVKKEEQRNREIKEYKAKKRAEAHVKEVTNMDLPLDWENVFNSDVRTQGIHVDSISDGLILSLSNLGRVDIEYISCITGEDYKTIICELKGSIYQNPNTWGECFFKGWETAEEYLSGNLMKKWKEAKEANESYNGYFEDNVKAIENVIPEPVVTSDIYVTLGSPWIPTDVIDEFIEHLFGRTPGYYTYNKGDIWYSVKHWPESGKWEIPWKSRYRDIMEANYVYVRLLLFNPIDLRGIPTANAEKTLAIWLKPKIFQMDEREDVVNILFLDEISAAPQSVQAAVYQITLDRVVGEHKLPENCIVIAAGNRMTDKSVTFKMPKALANRLLHIQVEGNFNEWKKWAISSGINEKVLGFLSFRQSYLMGFDSSSDDLAFATPRSWEMVSNLLNHVSDNIEEMYSLISGLVGIGVAIEFRTWARVYKQLPNMESIFEGAMPNLPTNTDTMYALIASMTAYAREHKDEMARITNSIRYAERMPPDFSTVLMKDYMYLEKGYKEKLMNIPEFYKWLQSKGRLLNGSV